MQKKKSTLSWYLTLILLSLILAWSSTAQIPQDALWVNNAASKDGDGTKNKPFISINAALKNLQPGGTVVVKTGIYYETVLMPAGLPDKPTTLMAFPGNRVIINGMRPVGGWEATGNGIYKTVVKTRPDNLYVNLKKQRLSREPNDGWWASASIEQSKGKGSLICPGKLKGYKKKIINGEVYIWTQHGNTFFTMPIINFNNSSGKISISITNKWLKLTDGDNFFLQNHPSLIDSPGEWAALPANGSYELFFKPADKADLEKTFVPFETRRVVGVIKKKHVKIIGIDAVGAGSRGCGIKVLQSDDVEIRNCRTYLNNNFGISLRKTKNSKIVNNLSFNNESNGIVLLEAKSILVEGNEIAYNGIDGLIVSWKSSDITIKKNYIHNHFLWGHPDNMQFYRDVENIKILDNLLIGSGQTIMMEQAKKLLFKNNMFIGSIANMLIFGHKNTSDCKLINNTLAYAGYSCISFTDKNYNLINNILVLGHKGTFFSIKKITDYHGENNLYWTAPGLKGTIPDDKQWNNNIAELQKNNPNKEKGSIEADPLFVNAPVIFQVLDGKKLDQGTRSKLYLRGGVKGFSTGDNIEINFDGKVRKATEVTGDYIVIKPALNSLPLKPYTVANWKTTTDFNLDLSLKPDSPAMKLANGKPAGSSINIKNYRKGDFNGDGIRDIPKWPNDVSWHP